MSKKEGIITISLCAVVFIISIVFAVLFICNAITATEVWDRVYCIVFIVLDIFTAAVASFNAFTALDMIEKE